MKPFCLALITSVAVHGGALSLLPASPQFSSGSALTLSIRLGTPGGALPGERKNPAAPQITAPAPQAVPKKSPRRKVASTASKTPVPAPSSSHRAVSLGSEHPGSGGGNGGTALSLSWQSVLAEDYRSTLRSWFGENIAYPPLARLRGIEGRLVMRVTIDRAGGVKDASIAESSGSALLDEAAQKSVRAASPLPAMPPQLELSAVEVLVPLRYELRNPR